MKGPSVRPHGDEGIGRDGGDLQEHEEVEYVPGDGDSQQAGQAQEEGAVEEWCLFDAHFPPHAHQGVGSDHGTDSGHDHEDVGADRIDPVLDSPGCCPTSQGIDDGSPVQDLSEEQDGDRRRSPMSQAPPAARQPRAAS